MKLNELFKGAPEIEITNIAVDSRKVTKNGLFFCVKGLKNDGHNFIKQAIENGAIAICYSDELSEKQNAVYIKVNDVLKTFSRIANQFYDYVSSKIHLVGITGTNGKTSVACIVNELFNNKHKSGYIGTLGISFNHKKYEANYTTPGLIENLEILTKMKKEECDYCAMEVSSIGIDQGRVDGLEYNVAAYTNLSHDHLDYHGSMNEYFIAKKKFFDDLKPGTIAITNVDDEYGLKIVADTKANVFTYGIEKEADYQVLDLKLKANETTFNLKTKNRVYHIITNLVARYNVYNLVCALAIYEKSGNNLEEIIKKLSNLNQIEGRMHRINLGQKYQVIIDFAHTPDGLNQIFEFAKEITPKDKRIISVFGSAGKRDVVKRKIFGEIADKYADLIILTEDDPRDEQVYDIATKISEGIKTKNYVIITNRTEAIENAISLINTDDTLLILGKGDEKYLYREFGKEYYQGDDVIAEKAIAKRLREEKLSEIE